MLCAVCATEPEQRQLQKEAEERGMGWSALGESYLSYDRDLFVNTLNDWSWCGEVDPPSW